jgi:hypothetical protein
MKTSMQLPDFVVLEAKKLALERRCTFRDLVLAGLQRELREARKESVSTIVSRLRKGVQDRYWGEVGADQYVAEERSGWAK